MGQLFIYSNSAGTFVFNQNFYLIDTMLLADKEIIKNSEILEKGGYTEHEKRMIKKHSKGQFTAIGFKKSEFESVKADQDFGKRIRITEALNKEGIFERIRHADTIITKHKVKNSVGNDTFVCQAINNIIEMERMINTMAKRLREWYSYYLPEFSRSISDHNKFAEIISKRSKEEILRELRMDKEYSMGAEVSRKDLAPVIGLAKEISNLYTLKENQTEYIEGLMRAYCPNISAVAGPVIGAKLLEKAGSLKRLSEFPSSTVQVLGAEEAFFRHMTTGSRPPKYGFIHEHPFVAQAGKDDKGRIARALADKISIAAKVDYFRGDFVGDKLRKMVEAKLTESKKGKEMRRR